MRRRRKGGGKDQGNGSQGDSAAPVNPVVDEQTVKANYETRAREFKASVEAGISDARFESITLFQPNYEPHPHRAEFSMEFSSNGTRFSIDHIPVKASVDGVWVFPGVEDVLSQISLARLAAAEVRANASRSGVANRPAQPIAGSPAQPVAGSPTRSSPAVQSGGFEVGGGSSAERTVVIEWESPRRSGAPAPVTRTSPQPNEDRVRPASEESQGSSAPPPRTPPAGNSRESSSPAAMPFNREVQIKF